MTNSVSQLHRLKAQILAVAMQLVFEGQPWDADILLERSLDIGIEAHVVAKYSGAIITQLRHARVIEPCAYRPSRRNDSSLIVVWRPRGSNVEVKTPNVIPAYGKKRVPSGVSLT